MRLFGRTGYGTQRFRCNWCGKTYVWCLPGVKQHREFHWFRLWVTESCSIRRLGTLSGFSRAKLQRIKDRWLGREPPIWNKQSAWPRHLLLDGTYFHKKGCLVAFMNASSSIIPASLYLLRESDIGLSPWMARLKEQGLNPKALTMDGHIKVIEALRRTWPGLVLQRCLCHIQRQGLQWLRTFPKTQAARELRGLLNTLPQVRRGLDRDRFLRAYRGWRARHGAFVASLPNTSVAFKDLKRTVTLINNALPDMFHYLGDHRVAPTTNRLESFFSRLKSDLYRHRGLSEPHKISYLKWYCHFKSQKNSNTL